MFYSHESFNSYFSSDKPNFEEIKYFNTVSNYKYFCHFLVTKEIPRQAPVMVDMCLINNDWGLAEKVNEWFKKYRIKSSDNWPEELLN